MSAACALDNGARWQNTGHEARRTASRGFRGVYVTLDAKTDALVLGGGPAGSTTAMRLLQQGIQPLIVEREVFPRYHIGESMTGECGALCAGPGLRRTRWLKPNTR